MDEASQKCSQEAELKKKYNIKGSTVSDTVELPGRES